MSVSEIFIRISLILMKKSVRRMGLSRMVDHMKPTLRPKSDQEFSHSLSDERTSTLKKNTRIDMKAVMIGFVE
ncbi:hypothetical protein TUM17577_48710 [Enterobacter asburiae]|nr:hypothetical protein TUM17577_48710 [Enterobacter asburiae]